MSNGTDCASNGVTTVLMDHNKTANMSTVLQPKRFAVLAPMIWKDKMTRINICTFSSIDTKIQIDFATKMIHCTCTNDLEKQNDMH